MLEIYNETLNDLLTKSSDAALDIRVQGKSVSVPGLTRIQVQTEADILAVMETGEKNRKIASTKMNTQRCSDAAQEEVLLMKLRFHLIIIFFFFLLSSRSHLVVALEVEGSDEVSGLTSRGTLTLCDLAGSERISKTEAEGQRLVEAAAINKSLTALGQVQNLRGLTWSGSNTFSEPNSPARLNNVCTGSLLTGAHTHHLHTVLTLSSEVCRLSLRCSVLSGVTPSTSPSGTLSSRSCCSPASAGTQRYPPSFYNHRRSVFTTEERCVSS